MAVTFNRNMKIILAQDSVDSMTDAIADLLLVHKGDEAKVREIFEDRLIGARNHYSTEREGESEGYHVFVDPQDGSSLIDLRTDPA